MIQTLALIRWESPETYYILGATFLGAISSARFRSA
jgi:hypothetical protein